MSETGTSKFSANILCIATDNDLPESEMIVALHQLGLKIVVVIDPSSNFIAKYREAGIPVCPLKIGSRIDIHAIKRLRALLVQNGTQIAHCFSKRALSNFLIASIGLGVKSIGYRGIGGNLSFFDPGSWLTFLNPSLDSIVCVCRSIEEYLSTYPNLKRKVQTIHKGHDLSWYDPRRLIERSELGIEKNNFLVSCVCNFRPRKGLGVLLDAMLLLPDNVELLLVGNSNKKDLARELHSRGLAERVHYLGFKPEAWRYAGASDLFVMPSLKREGLPKGVIEAMAVGVPAVVTKVGGMPEIVQSGDSGTVVSPGDSEDLASAILYYYENRDVLVQHGKAANQRIHNNFNISQTVDRYLELYQRLLRS